MHISTAHLTRLASLLQTTSKGRYGRDKALDFCAAARNSIGSTMPAKSLELHTIRLIRELDSEIADIEAAIEKSVEETHSTITTIPGLGFRMGARVLAEIGNFSCFDSPDKILAYAGMSPCTYQSVQLTNCHSHIEKRGSKYLRSALFNSGRYVWHWDPGFAAYQAKKRAEGKHYYPLVMDAPLSAFDKRRIKAICSAIPETAEQVIIFIKDTDGELAEEHLGTKVMTRH